MSLYSLDVRHSIFNGQIEDDELTKENETKSRKEIPWIVVRCNPREEGGAFSVYVPLRWNKIRILKIICQL